MGDIFVVNRLFFYFDYYYFLEKGIWLGQGSEEECSSVGKEKQGPVKVCQ